MFHCLQALNMGLIELVVGRMTNYLSFWPCSALERFSIYWHGCTHPCVLTIDHPLAATGWCKHYCNCKNYAILCSEIVHQWRTQLNAYLSDSWDASLSFIWTTILYMLILPKTVFSICHTTRTGILSLSPPVPPLYFSSLLMMSFGVFVFYHESHPSEMSANRVKWTASVDFS